MQSSRQWRAARDARIIEWPNAWPPPRTRERCQERDAPLFVTTRDATSVGSLVAAVNVGRTQYAPSL